MESLRDDAVSRRRKVNVQPVVETFRVCLFDQCTRRIHDTDAVSLQYVYRLAYLGALSPRVGIPQVRPSRQIFRVDEVAEWKEDKNDLCLVPEYLFDETGVALE